MDISKVKIKQGSTEILYFASDRKDSRETAFSSYDPQTEEFIECLQPLKPWVLHVLDLPGSYGEGLEITGLTIKHEDSGIGVVISAVKQLGQTDAPLCLNTPYIPPQRNENTRTPMCSELQEEVQNIMDMCEEFMGGKHRAQGELFDGQK